MRRCSFRIRHTESGLYLTIVAMTLFVLLAIIGLAVDSGFAYRSRLFMQSAVDVAAVKGTAQVLENTSSDPTILNYSQNLARLNMQINGFQPSPPASISANIVNPRRGVHVDATAPQRTWIVNVIPGFQQFIQLTVSSEALSRTLSVMMVLDRSGSMGACMDNPCPNPIYTRIWAAKIAASYVVQKLQVGDQIGLVSFSNNVATDRVLSPPLNGLNMAGEQAAMYSAINGLTAGGTTNTWSALSRGRDELVNGMNSHSTWTDPGRGKVILFLSDGAPNSPIPVNMRSWCDESVPGDPRMQMTGAFTAQKPRLFQYTRALNEAIMAQTMGITVNVVGIGERDPYYDPGPLYPRPPTQYTVGRNPFQNVPDANYAREPFLMHLANDQEKMWNPPAYSMPVPYPTPGPVPFWDFPCTVLNPRSLDPMNPEVVLTGADRAAHTRGRYAFALNAAQLIQIFDEMIKSARIKLVS